MARQYHCLLGRSLTDANRKAWAFVLGSTCRMTTRQEMFRLKREDQRNEETNEDYWIVRAKSRDAADIKHAVALANAGQPDQHDKRGGNQHVTKPNRRGNRRGPRYV